MPKPMYSHKIELDLRPTTESLEKLTEELMEETKAKVAREVLVSPLRSFSLSVLIMGRNVVNAFEEKDPDSPLAIAVQGITDALDILDDAVEAAEEVTESQTELRATGQEVHALQSLLTLAERLQALARWVSRRTPRNYHDDEDTRSDAADEIVAVLEKLIKTTAAARDAFAAYSTEVE